MSADVIDVAVFEELNATAGADFVAELVDTFLDEAPGMFTSLETALSTGDADGFRRAAHSLKSNGLTFGATAFAAQARGLELGGLPTDRAQGQDAVAALRAAFDAAARALKDLRHA